MRSAVAVIGLWMALGVVTPGCAGCGRAARPVSDDGGDAAVDGVSDSARDTLPWLEAFIYPDMIPEDFLPNPCGSAHLPATPTRVTLPRKYVCGRGCRQVTRRDSDLEYDLKGDVLVYGRGGSVYTTNLKTGEEWLLCEKGKPSRCKAPSTDGKHIVYARYVPGPGSFLSNQIFVVDAATRVETERACVKFGQNNNCSIYLSAAAKAGLLVRLSKKAGCDRPVIYPYAGGEPIVVGTLEALYARADGPWLVWQEWWPKPGTKAYVERLAAYNTDTHKKVIFPKSSGQIRPRIDGTKVVAVIESAPDEGDGDTDIAIHDIVQGTEIIYKHPARQDRPDVSGSLVVWQDWRHNPGGIAPRDGVNMSNSDIYLYDIKTGKETQLTCGVGFESAPRIDGRRVTFIGVLPGIGGGQIFMIDLDQWDGHCVAPRLP